MFFSVGVETPKDDATAYGLIVPALCTDDYGCFSAADSQQEIARMAREAILTLIDEAVSRGNLDIRRLNDAGYLIYAAMPDFADYDSWFVLDVDLSAFEGKPQRLNISLPDTLIQRIDNRVRDQPGTYRDRSHFLAEAARHELE
ncbi:type II toxin-antitoxin system HicB family antitoxin [Pectobacterium brasiliense]|uniref:Type II toxin-antitoxin system HicB family antitoxin n=1 Tax=Pectobacterium brasiliense TaxID=180957 RepID=A0AAW9H0L1_9GAMM|nr:type II toxin-antitoxin system HicB family antitoxin [Pectobacterium brasiliense]MDY4377275.1 type II toxin-antitoxin system HicB family antitoxin [Pectobacterium brasiliense]